MDKDILKKVQEIDFQNNFMKEAIGNIEIDYNSKRFNKYIKKLEDSLFEYLMSFEQGFFSTQKIEKNLQELIFKIVNTYFASINYKLKNLDNGYSPSEISNKLNICSMFDLYFFDDDMFEISFNNFNWNIYKALIIDYKTPEVSWNFNDIYKKALITSSKNNIKRKAGEFFISKETAPIDSQNYFLTLPSGPMDYINILKDILNLIKVDIVMICNDKLPSKLQNFVQVSIEDNYNKSKQEIDQYVDEQFKLIEIEIKNKFGELEKEYNEKLDELNSLDNLKNKVSINEEIISNQNDIIKKLIKENNKLKEKYNNLVSKANIDEEIQEKEKIYKEIDTNLNYIFLVSEDITFKDSILNVFPNSKIISNNKTNLNPNNIDYVIVLTNHIGHAEYYGVKKQCKNKNIPFLHCPFDNFEMIKELIYEYINI